MRKKKRTKERKKKEKWKKEETKLIKGMRKERKNQTWRGGVEEKGQDK
jgi:hypothetical protein